MMFANEPKPKFDITCSTCHVKIVGSSQLVIAGVMIAHERDAHQVKQKLGYERYMNKVSVLVEDHFPKGKTNMRGEAMVLVADILRFLIEQGVVEDEQP